MTGYVLALASKKMFWIGSGALGLLALVLDWSAAAAAIVVVIAAISTAAVAIINAIGKNKMELLAAQAVVSAKVDVIQGHVDGMSTAAAAKRDADAEMILTLRQLLSDAEQRAAVAALARTSVDIAKAAVPTAPVRPPGTQRRDTDV